MPPKKKGGKPVLIASEANDSDGGESASCAGSDRSFSDGGRASRAAGGGRGVSAMKKGRKRKQGPIICKLSPHESRHNSDALCKIWSDGRKIWWADKHKDGRPRGGCCKACKVTHIKLHPSIAQPALIQKLAEDEAARKNFDAGRERWEQNQKRTFLDQVADACLESSDNDSEGTKARKERKTQIIAERQQRDNTEQEQREQAHHNKYTRNSAKRRGQWIKESVFIKKNPDAEVPDKLKKQFESKANPGTWLWYVKVYKDKDEDAIDFSEDEGEEVLQQTTVDDGLDILTENQVANTYRSMVETQLSVGGSAGSGLYASNVMGYTGMGGAAGSGVGSAPLPSGSPTAGSLRARSPASSDPGEESESEDGSEGEAPLLKKLRKDWEKKSSPKKDKQQVGTTDVGVLENVTVAIDEFKNSTDPEDVAQLERDLSHHQAEAKKAIPLTRKKKDWFMLLGTSQSKRQRLR